MLIIIAAARVGGLGRQGALSRVSIVVHIHQRCLPVDLLFLENFSPLQQMDWLTDGVT